MKRNKDLDKYIPLCSYDEYGGVWTRDAVYKILEKYTAAMQARIEKATALIEKWRCEADPDGEVYDEEIRAAYGTLEYCANELQAALKGDK